MTKRIYADYAAATPTDPQVAMAMKPFLTEIFGNPSSLHTFGRQAAAALDHSRQSVADFLNAQNSEVYFTSSGTESNNLAILGVAKASRQKGQHIITTAIEHPSVLNACKALEKDGWAVTYLPVSSEGMVEVEALTSAFKKETVLVSIHLANSEIGVVQSIGKLARVAKKRNVYFHTDACQAGAFLDLNVEKLGVDLLTFNGSKMYGPKGVAVLYARTGVQIFPIFYGGGQEQSLRSGTENLPGIIGLGVACEIAKTQRSTDAQRIGQLRDKLQQAVEKLGGQTNARSLIRLPNHLSTIVPTDQTDLVARLDNLGIAVSAGSACSSRTVGQSQVLQGIGLDSSQANRVLRLTLGRPTTETDIKAIALAIQKIIQS